jgi:hypothetical protein
VTSAPGKMAHFVSMRYGVSWWKADRWIKAAVALERLPAISEALCSGELSIDKVVELTRFATRETEARLIRWAIVVSTAAVRRRADLEVRRESEEVQEAERVRSCEWWYVEDRFGLQADLPAADGAVVAKALERLSEQIPAMPGEEDPYYAAARRADALVALCSAKIADDPDPDRATVVVHVRVGDPMLDGGAEVENGPVIHPETARRLLCESRVQAVVEDGAGDLLGLGRVSREPSAWMTRQLRYRDGGCVFPGCGPRRFVVAHHLQWWRHGGRTDLSNLVVLCLFHHKLVHEHGWAVEREEDGVARWSGPMARGTWRGPRHRACSGLPKLRSLRWADVTTHALSTSARADDLRAAPNGSGS